MHFEGKTALLHYWLTVMRGGEMVFRDICRMFPEGEIYTHAVCREILPEEMAALPLHESFISRLPLGRKHCQKYLPLMPLAQKRWDFSGYRMIISSESGPVKGIIKPAGCPHICYCHTPMRYVWDMYDEYYRSAGIPGKIAMALFKSYMRRYDLASAECVDRFVANSAFVAERIKRIYNRKADVVYPPVDVEYFSRAPEMERKHYLFLSAFVPYKRPELVLEAFARMPDKKLIMAGHGGNMAALRKQAGKNVEFVICPDRQKIRELYASSKALIFPGIEDFGIVPVEAQAAGCPVIAMNIGGTAETVADGSSGILMKQQSVDEIINAVEELETRRFDTGTIKANASRFAAENFTREFGRIVAEYLTV